MNSKRTAQVFFDSSVLFSAIYSQTGGSHKLLELVRKGDLEGFTSQTVIDELKDNLYKFSPKTKVEINSFIKESKLIVRERIAQDEIKPHLKTVEKKDAHVLAGAISTGCKYLVTLDKKHLNNPEVIQRVGQFVILAPKELLRKLGRNG